MKVTMACKFPVVMPFREGDNHNDVVELQFNDEAEYNKFTRMSMEYTSLQRELLSRLEPEVKYKWRIFDEPDIF